MLANRMPLFTTDFILLYRYYPGRIQLIQRSMEEPIYVVKFDDGDSCGVLIDQMVLLPKQNVDSK